MAPPINRRLLGEARLTRWYIAGVAGVGIVQSVLVIGQAKLISETVAGVFETRLLNGIGIVVTWLMGVFLARAALTWLTSWLAHRASAEVKSSLRRRVMAARLAKPDSGPPTASLVSVVTSGLDAIDGYFGKYLPQFLMAVTVPVILAVMVGLHDLTTLVIVLVTIPIIPLFMVLIGWTTSEQVARRFKVQLRLANHFADLMAGLPTLQIFGRAGRQTKGLKSSEDSSRRETMSTLRVAFLSAGVLELAATLSVALIAVTIGFRVLAGSLGLETALYIIILAPEIYLPIRLVGSFFHDSTNGNAAADAAYAMIDEAEASSLVEASTGLSSQSLLELQNVSYRYAGQSDDVLSNLSLAVAPGEIVALTGPSGGGKTTALRLALGLNGPTTGQVVVDGAELTATTVDNWRCQVAWVGQVPGLLGPTVADDVALGDPSAGRSSLRQALDRVGGQSLALDRAVGEAGEDLSAGERRRVAMARALVKVENDGARLLLLDEPTAGLDESREAEVLQTLRNLGVAVLVVSHRASVLKAADRVVRIGVVD